MRTRGARLVAASVFAVATIANLHAQEPRRLTHPDSVPYELAAALIGGAFGPEPQIQVGGAPGWAMQRLYVPTNGHVLGSAYLGTTVTVVVALPIGADSTASQQVRSELMQHGWADPPRPEYGYGGFRPASMTTPGLQSATRFTVCSADYLLIGEVRREAGMALHLVYRLSNGTAGVCHPPQFQGNSGTSPRFPTLYEPGGTQDPRSVTTCYPQSGDGATSGTSAIFRAPMPADRVLDHFARQLTDSGWTRVRDSVTVARGEWTRPDSAGTFERLSITVTAPRGVHDPQCHEAQMSVSQPRKP